MNGVYWGLTSTLLLDRPDALSREEMIEWVLSCWHPESGGFRPHPGHDPHIHATLSAIQILVMQEAIDRLDKPMVIQYILSLFDPERGSFSGDSWGETDARFSYCAVAALALLDSLHRLDRHKTVAFLPAVRTSTAASAWSKAPNPMPLTFGLASPRWPS